MDDPRHMRDRMSVREATEDVNEESVENNENLEPSSCSVVSGLNLVLILSFLASSDDHIEEIEEREIRNLNHKRKYSRSRSNCPTRRQQSGGFNRAIGKQQTPKIQTKMRDCRHSRRL